MKAGHVPKRSGKGMHREAPGRPAPLTQHPALGTATPTGSKTQKSASEELIWSCYAPHRRLSSSLVTGREGPNAPRNPGALGPCPPQGTIPSSPAFFHSGHLLLARIGGHVPSLAGSYFRFSEWPPSALPRRTILWYKLQGWCRDFDGLCRGRRDWFTCCSKDLIAITCLSLESCQFLVRWTLQYFN